MVPLQEFNLQPGNSNLAEHKKVKNQFSCWITDSWELCAPSWVPYHLIYSMRTGNTFPSCKSSIHVYLINDCRLSQWIKNTNSLAVRNYHMQLRWAKHFPHIPILTRRWLSQERLRLKLHCALHYIPSKWQRWDLGLGCFAPKASILSSPETEIPGSTMSTTGETFFSLRGSFVQFSSCRLHNRLFFREFISGPSQFLGSWTVTADHFGVGGSISKILLTGRHPVTSHAASVTLLVRTPGRTSEEQLWECWAPGEPGRGWPCPRALQFSGDYWHFFPSKSC